jgi:hypothetical protein
MRYRDCRFCGGQGCLSCPAEKERDERDAAAAGSVQSAVNVHVHTPRQAAAAREEIRRRTGQEPVICLHLYAASMDELRDLLRVDGAEQGRRESALERLLRRTADTADNRGEARPSILDSAEMRNARQMLAKWQQHTTNYAFEQVTHWKREIARLEMEESLVPAPADMTGDADMAEDEEQSETGGNQ